MKNWKENIADNIRARRSVRTYDGRNLEGETKDLLLDFMRDIPNPWGISVKFKLMNAKEHGLHCPVVSGTDLYVGGKIKCVPFANAAFGYSFEMLVLYAQALGVGTVWLGGTMNRAAYEIGMKLEADEMMPCASPLGYTAAKKSVKETVMRKAIKADERYPFEEVFFDGTYGTPLTKEKAGKLAEVLEMVRLAPSAVNKQPWRVVVTEDAVHFYLKRSKAFSGEGRLDMQMIDMGIALCHFALAAEKEGICARFVMEDPGISVDDTLEYVGSYQI